MSDHGFKDFAEYVKAVREKSEKGIIDSRLREIKQDPLTEEEIDKLEIWVRETFPEPCTCNHDLINHDDPDHTGMLFCTIKDCTCTNFQHVEDKI